LSRSRRFRFGYWNVARRADPGPWTDRLRDPAVRNDRSAVEKLAEDADPARTSTATLSVLAQRMGELHLNPGPLLTAWGKILESGPPQARPFIARALSHWQKDSDLAGIRSAAALARLPADQRAALGQLWADVAALLKKAAQGN
jgi:hypothetical protein